MEKIGLIFDRNNCPFNTSRRKKENEENDLDKLANFKEEHENDNFIRRKLVMHGYNIFRGVDLNKNGNFKEEKLIMYGYKKCMGRS